MVASTTGGWWLVPLAVGEGEATRPTDDTGWGGGERTRKSVQLWVQQLDKVPASGVEPAGAGVQRKVPGFSGARRQLKTDLCAH